MNNNLLLVTAITLLYRESQLTTNNENSANLVRELISSIKLPELSIGLDHDREILDGLKNAALTMCANPPNHEYEQHDILQTLQVICKDNLELFNAFKDSITNELSDKSLKRTCLNLRKTLNDFFKEEKIREIINDASYMLKFQKSKIVNMKDFVAEIVARLEPYQIDSLKRDPAIIASANTSDLESGIKVFANVKSESEGTAIMRTGWQGMNRMLDGGLRFGEEMVQAALQHNYKTGMNLAMFMDLALFNTPVLKDPNKKAALLRISCEDTIQMNYNFIFKRLKGIEAQRLGKLDEMTEEMINEMISKMSPEELSAYVHSALSVNGFDCFFEQINPSMATYRTIQNLVLELEAKGYEVKVVFVDYLLKIPTTGCDGNAAGEALRNMYEKMANFAKHHDFIFGTPHQISTDAKMMIREGKTGFVQLLVGGGYYAGSKQLDQVVDLEIFQHIEKLNGESYLTLQRGKHRKDQIRMTPYEDLYMVLKFHPIFGLLPDVGGLDTTLSKVGAKRKADTNVEELPFWEM